MAFAGVIEIPILGGLNLMQMWYFFKDFPYNSALLGLVLYIDPCELQSIKN